MDSLPLIETDEVKDCRRIDDDHYRLNGRRFLLIYAAPKFGAERVRSHVRDVCGNKLADVRIYLEVHPTEGERMYVLIDTHKRFQSSASKVFDISRNHPITFAVRCKTDWYTILACFPEDNAQLEYSPEDGESDPISSLSTVPASSPVLLELSDMKYWQADVLALMRSNISAMRALTAKDRTLKGCKINTVITRCKCGRSSLVSALKRAKPASVHVVEGIVDTRELAALQRIPIATWNREILIVSIGTTSDIEGLDAMYVYIDAVLTKACRDIWIFSSLPCVMEQDESEKVVAYGVDQADWKNGDVGRLIPRRLIGSKRS